MKVTRTWLFYLVYILPALWYSAKYSVSARDELLLVIGCFVVVNFVTFTFAHAYKTFIRVLGEQSRWEGYVNVFLFVATALIATAIVLPIEADLWIYFVSFTLAVSLLRLANET